VTLPFDIIKKYLKAKEELWKLKYFTMKKEKIFKKKKSSKRNKNPSRYYNFIINHKFQVSTQAKINIIFQESSYTNSFRPGKLVMNNFLPVGPC
jgi:hypothetical protein